VSDQLCPSCAGRSDDGLLCPRCWSRTERDLRAIPGLWREMETTLTRQSQTGTGNGGKNSVRPLPFDVTASEVSAEVKTCLVNWVRTFTHGDWPDDTVVSICAWLLARDQRIRGHEEAPEFVDEIADVVHRLRRLIDLRPEMVYLGPCDKIMGYEPGDDGGQHPVTCRHQMYARQRDESYDCPGEPGVPCDAVYNVKARRDEMVEKASYQLATISLCAQLLGMFGLPVKVETIDSWTRPRTRINHATGQEVVVRTAQLWRKGVDEKGVNTYLVGDVEALVREMLERKQQRKRTA
jgi:hypothetical protein